jgi:hypothetical protein
MLTVDDFRYKDHDAHEGHQVERVEEEAVGS